VYYNTQYTILQDNFARPMEVGFNEVVGPAAGAVSQAEDRSSVVNGRIGIEGDSIRSALEDSVTICRRPRPLRPR
jgi:hypothetical protein